jgi:hypothetical protein
MFDRKRYERALAQMDEAPTRADYYAGLCALAEAQGRVPDLVHVAKAFGLPPVDSAALRAFEEDVISGRIPRGTTAAQVRERFYIPQASGSEARGPERSRSSSTGLLPTRSAVTPLATPSRNGTKEMPSWWLAERRVSAADVAEHVLMRPKSELPVTISLSERVWHALRGYAQASSDGRETGGFLFGQHVRSWHRRIDVGWVTDMVKSRAEDGASLDVMALVHEKSTLSVQRRITTSANKGAGIRIRTPAMVDLPRRISPCGSTAATSSTARSTLGSS